MKEVLKGKTQLEVAEQSQIKIAYLSRVLQGKVNLTLESLCRLELALDREIFKISDNPNSIIKTISGEQSAEIK